MRRTMVRASDLLAEGRRIPGLAGTSVVTPDWAPVARRIRAGMCRGTCKLAVLYFFMAEI